MAYASYHKAQAHPSSNQSDIYSAGSEFLLCQAQVQIMGAVMGVLTESVTESLKGFYKLRKAFISLEGLLEQEKHYLAKIEQVTGEPVVLESGSTALSPDASAVPSTTGSAEKLSGRANNTAIIEDSDADEFFDAIESPNAIRDTVTTSENDLAGHLADVAIDEPANGAPTIRRLSSTIQDGPDADLFTNHVDSFIHSSSNMCFGMLLLLVSMLPPAFSTLTKIAGFKGDRKRGIELLWQASKFPNLNGAFAGLMLLGYYNGFIGFCDILPSKGSGAYPRERCKELLASSRSRYAKVCGRPGLCESTDMLTCFQSCLWMLEEVRMLANEKRLQDAVNMLESKPDSSLKQVHALQCFEMSLCSMGLHRYEQCGEMFQKVKTCISPR
jgi:hypothetical protein